MMNNPEQKQGRLLITGATGGMGRASALLAAQQGYDLVLADLSQGMLDAVASECEHLGAAATSHLLDVTDADAVAGLATAAAETGIDGIVHTVGLSPTMADGERIIQVDLVGFVATLEALRPALRPGGCAVCISSMSAHMVPPNPELESALADPLAPDLAQRVAQLPGNPLADAAAAYPYAKKALIHYVERHAAEWGQEGKRLVTISPGLIDTTMGKQEEASNQENFAWMDTLIALQRHGEPEEIAGAALFLVSEHASYITGCDLLVDGGFVGTMRHTQPAEGAG